MVSRTVPIRQLLYLFLALALGALSVGEASAQQFLGKARQACRGILSVETPQQPVVVQPFRAMTIDVAAPQIKITCQDQTPITVECPSGTNRVLIDRTQGSNIYSIICLRN